MSGVAVVFSGQGAQRVGMGASLVASSKAAAAVFAKADEVLGFSLSEACFVGPAERLTPTDVCQPALYVHGLAAVAAFQERFPEAAVVAAAGLSLGELTALQVANVFDFATGLCVVAERGRLMQLACEASEGGMVSLIGGTPEAAVSLAAELDLDVANRNCPGQIVLSGALAAIEEAAAHAKGLGFKMAAKLDVAGAYHSRLMAPAAAAFADFLSRQTFRAPEIPVFSNVTGLEHDDPAKIKELLVAQVTGTVRWEDCFAGILARQPSAILEAGPGGVLAGLAKRISRDCSVRPLSEAADLEALG